MTPLEIIAGIFAALTIIKMVVILVNKQKWLHLGEKVYGKSGLSMVVFAILGLLVLYYLLQEMTLVQIYAALAFTALLMGIGFMQYSKEMMPFVRKIYKSKLSFVKVVYVLLWLALSVLVLVEIFG